MVVIIIYYDCRVLSLVFIRGAFFWYYFGIDGICVLLGAIPFSE